MVPHVIPQLITRNNITWCTWHKSMHYGILHPSYPIKQLPK
jgi:hypothetical protein